MAAGARRRPAARLPDRQGSAWPHLWTPTYEAAWVTSAAIASAYRPGHDLPAPAADHEPQELVEAVATSRDEHAIKFAEVAIESQGRGGATAIGTGLRAVTLIG